MLWNLYALRVKDKESGRTVSTFRGKCLLDLALLYRKVYPPELRERYYLDIVE